MYTHKRGPNEIPQKHKTKKTKKKEEKMAR